MRSLKRNQRKIWYALRNVSASSDTWGNTHDITEYSQPQEYKINVTAVSGEAEPKAFGSDLQYDREMITCDMGCPIDEYSRIWIDRNPTETHNYEVIAKSESLNSIRYAIKKVDVRNEKSNQSQAQ